MSILEQGRAGEQWSYRWLRSRGFVIFQADWIAQHPHLGESYFLFEVKAQDRFEAPPFDGHGLPPWQIESRETFRRETGMRTRLLVHEPSTGATFSQWLDVLEQGPSFDTTLNPRRIYPLESYVEHAESSAI